MSNFIITEDRPRSSRGGAAFALQVRLADDGPRAIPSGVWADLRLALSRIGRPGGGRWEEFVPAINFAWERALRDTRRRARRRPGDEETLEEMRIAFLSAVVEAERRNCDEYLCPPDPASPIEGARSGAHEGRIVGAGTRRAGTLRACFGLA